jgi:signal transduction histidine kinase
MKFPSGIQKIFPKRVGHQIFCILFFLAVIPLLTLGSLFLNTSQKAIKTTVWLNHKEIATQTTGEIKEHIEGTRQTLFVAAAILGRLQADPWRQETTVVELAIRNPAFQRISSVNMQGQEIVTSELGTSRRDQSNEEAFQKASWGQSYISEVKVSNDHIPFLIMAEPIRELGRVRGVLLAELNLRNVWDIVDQIHIGKKGMAYLIDQDGRIIAHPDKKLVLRNADIAHPEVTKNVLAGEAGNIEEFRNGQSWLVSYAPIKKLHWGLIIAQPESEAFASLELMKIQSFFILFLSIVVALLTSSILAHYMSQPLKVLIEGTHRIAHGNFSHYYRIHSRGEIDRLFFSFNRMMRKLRHAQEVESLSMIGKAATVIAHELKNSLQLITTFVQILPERHEDKKFIKEFSETIPRELDSWNSLLKNMMAYTGHSRRAIKDIDVNGIIKEVTLLTHLKARQMDIDLMVNLEEELPLIKGDEERLRQVFLNLVTNAIEWTVQKGRISVSTRLKIGLRSNGYTNYVEIEVMNTGQELSAEAYRKMFEPFYTTKKGGLGLGLAISKQVVDEHNGTIRAFGQKEKTFFVVMLPINNQLIDNTTLADSHF